MSLALGRIYDRKSLWPAVQRELERRQFDELDKVDQEKYSEIKKLNESPSPLKADDQDLMKVSRPFGLRGLNHLDVGLILGTLALSNKIVDQYMECIATYVNSVRRPMASGVIQNINSGGQPAERPKTSYQAIEPMEIVDSEQPNYMSCRIMRTDQFRQCTSVERARKVLQDMNCSGDNFKHLDYLLIAYGSGGHHALLGVAPRQKFVFVIDSIEKMIFFQDDLPRGALLRILFSQVDRKETWPMYTQWAEKSETTMDGSPNVARQGDHYNCGVFAVTNAFCLAFGYDLMCYRQGDLQSLKRSRMVMELHQGSLGGKYAYDLLDVPDGPLYLNPVRHAQFAKHPGSSTLQQGIVDLLSDDEEDGSLDALMANTADYDGPGAHEQEEPFTDLTPSADRPPQERTVIDLRSDDGEPDDLDEAHGMVDVDAMDWESASAESSTASPPLSEGSEPDNRSRQVDKLIPSAEKAIYSDYARRLPHMRRAWNAGREYICETEIERRAFPPQLDPEYFQKHGFLYPSAPETPSDELLSQYTIEERKAAYARFPLQGIEEWEHESPEIIDRWAQNKMAAFVAQYWDETVKPDKWLVKGYDEWHKEHSAKERELHAFLKETWKTETNPDFESRRDALYQLEFIREKMKARSAKWKDLK